jgi:hypothetical protein
VRRPPTPGVPRTLIARATHVSPCEPRGSLDRSRARRNHRLASSHGYRLKFARVLFVGMVTEPHLRRLSLRRLSARVRLHAKPAQNRCLPTHFLARNWRTAAQFSGVCSRSAIRHKIGASPPISSLRTGTPRRNLPAHARTPQLDTKSPPIRPIPHITGAQRRKFPACDPTPQLVNVSTGRRRTPDLSPSPATQPLNA